MKVNGRHFLDTGKNLINNFFNVFFLIIGGDNNNQSHREFFLRSSISALTIILTNSPKVTVGSQPRIFLARVASPTKESTSAGLKKSLEILTYFFQLVIPITLKASSTNSATE